MDIVARAELKKFQIHMAEAQENLEALKEQADKDHCSAEYLVLAKAQKRLLNVEYQIRRLYQSYPEECVK